MGVEQFEMRVIHQLLEYMDGMEGGRERERERERGREGEQYETRVIH